MPYQYPFSCDDSEAADNSEALGVRMSPIPHHDGESFVGGDVMEMAKARAGASFHLGAASGVKGGGDEVEASDYSSAPESHSPAGVSARAVQGELASDSTPLKKSVADWASIIVQEPGNQRYRPTPWVVDTNEYVKHFKGTTFIAIGAIAKKVAQQEAKVFRRIRRKSGVSKEAVSWDHPLVQLFEQVNPLHTQFDLWYQMVAWRLLTGNSYWWKARNAFGKPAELWPLPSQWVWAIPSSKEFIAEYLVRGVFGGVDRYIKANDVLHIREMSIDWNGPGRFYGTPMAAAGATAIDLEEAMLQRLYYQFKNFNPPGLQYSTPEMLTQEQFNDMWLQIRMQQHTAELSGSPILTHSKVEAKEFKNTVREMDYSNSLQTIMSYILAMFGTPQAVVGVSREYNRCLDSETECLTSRGWVSHENLTMETEVACYDPSRDRIVYRRPTDIFRKKYSGKMHEWDGDRTSICVTPEHRMYVRPYGHGVVRDPRIIRACDMTRGARYKVQTAAKAACSEPHSITLNACTMSLHENRRSIREIDANLWLEFMGYYASEGCACHNPEREKHQYVINISQKIPAIVEKIRNCLLKMPSKFHESVGDDGVYRWHSFDKSLYERVVEDCGRGCVNKKVPSYVKDWPAESLEILLQALIDGDGSPWRLTNEADGTKSTVYYTTSKQLADDVQEIAVKCGYRAKIEKDIDKRGENRNPIYRVNLTTNVFVDIRQDSANYREFDYEGDIWCVTVPTSLFVVRRRGKVHITGNSNMVGALLSWAENTINPLLRHLGQHLTQGLAKEYDNDLIIEFDPVEVADSDGLRADVQACASAGAITPNEVREKLMKLPSFVGGGDKPYKPAGLEEAAYGNPKVDEGEGDGNGSGEGGDDLGELASGEEGNGLDENGLDENGNPIPPAGKTPSVDPFTGLESTGEFSGGDAGGESGKNAASGENAADDPKEAKANFITDSEAVADTSYEGPSSQVDLLQDDEETPDSQPLQLNGPDGVSAEEAADATGFDAEEIPDQFDGGETTEDDVTPEGADKGVDIPDQFKPTVPRGNGKGTAFSLGGGLGDKGGDYSASGEDEGEDEEEVEAGDSSDPFSRYAPKNAQSIDVDNIDMLLSDDDDGESQRSEVGVDDLDLLLAGEDEEAEASGEDEDEGDSAPPAKLPPKKPKPLPPAGKKKLAKAKDGDKSAKSVKISRSPAEVASARNRLKNWLAVHSQQENQAASDFARFFDAQANRIAAKLTAMIDRGEPIDSSTAESVIDWKLEDERLHDFASRIVRGAMDAGFKFAAKRGVELANERRIRREKLGIAGKVIGKTSTKKSLAEDNLPAPSLPLAKAPSGKQPFSSDIYDFLIDIPDDARDAAEAILADSLSMPYWSKVNQTTMATMEAVINEGIDAYQSAQAIAAKISERLGPAFNRKRAMTIARTEITTALNTAQITIMREVNNSPEMEPFALEWLSGDDHLTRPSHVKAHGQIVAMGEQFQVGNERCHYPGELTLSAKERINCRCAFVEVFVEDLPEGHPVRVKLEAAAEDKGVQLVGLEPDMWTGVTGGRKWTHEGGLGAETDWRMAKRRIEIEKADSSNSSDSTYTPPAGARGNARKVLQWKEKYGREVKGMTSVGWGRARQLASGKEISLSTVRRMSGFNRHRKNYAAARAKQKRESGKPWQYAGIVAWLGWGGNSGMAWAKRVSAVNKRWGGEVKQSPSSPLAKSANSGATEASDIFTILSKALSDRKYVRDKGGRFAHTGSSPAAPYKPSDRAMELRDNMRFSERTEASYIRSKAVAHKPLADDYQAAYDAARKDVSKIRRKLLAADYRQTKRLEKFREQAKVHRAAMESESAKMVDHVREQVAKIYQPGMSEAELDSHINKIMESKEYKKLSKPLEAARVKAVKAEQKIVDAQRKERERLLAALAISPEDRLQVKTTASTKETVGDAKYEVGSITAKAFKKCTKEHAKMAQDAADFLSSIGHKDSANFKNGDAIIHSLRASGGVRSFAAGNHIGLGKHATTSTAVHEIGHVLERDPNFAALAQGFLNKRCGDEWPHVRYRGKYGPEYGREDHFNAAFGDADSYVGKHYDHGATEVFAMGLQKLYEDPVGFAKNDPEYFNLMVGAMSGKIKSSGKVQPWGSAAEPRRAAV